MNLRELATLFAAGAPDDVGQGANSFSHTHNDSDAGDTLCSQQQHCVNCAS